MKATEDLVEEHHAVLVALKILGKVAAAIGEKVYNSSGKSVGVQVKLSDSGVF